MATVISEDRCAAGLYLRTNERFWLERNGAIMSGEADHDPLVQTLASHREASTAKLEADIAALVEALRAARCDIEAMPFSNKGLKLVPARLAAVARIDEALTRIQGEYRSGDEA